MSEFNAEKLEKVKALISAIAGKQVSESMSKFAIELDELSLLVHGLNSKMDMLEKLIVNNSAADKAVKDADESDDSNEDDSNDSSDEEADE